MKIKFHHKKAWYISGSVIGLFLISSVLAYGTNFKDPVSNFFRSIYPAVMVGNGFISEGYFDQATQLAQRIDPTVTVTQIRSEVVKIKKEQQLLPSLNVDQNKIKTDDEVTFYSYGKTDEYNKLVEKYFNNDKGLFTEFGVKPQVYEALLRIKYNSDLKANSIAYAKALTVIDDLNNGKSFEEIAKSQSDDKITGQLGGDLGFVSTNEILPELKKPLEESKVGEVKKEVVISRLGYHILYPIETIDKDGEKLWHLKQILIRADGFDSWLRGKLDKFRVIRLK
jgi:hypothetical protein